ncbi:MULTISPECIES: hypothetical protein [unclassified Nodularia (in: cyanobacteria)]|uniref:hypothetical protein n=1 Tax=unclassified Nodularia (in: cyanobacteria) TaxID=2656917 RepID=UPI00187ECBBD|nr:MULTISPECIES: hypothetical protein [unclassified Nodularia (in: cyanobacteria)]MBE9198804.1 hypothetical protein [Nodularia sp. LEGE 06071]MCC2692958.1 hypothetical protein [Nodularia sp. LEGE 04288]
MEHIQSVQVKPKPVRRQIKNKSGLVGSSNIFLYVLTRHPGLLFAGLFTMLLGTAALALYSLGYAGSADNVELEEIPAVVAQPITTTSEKSNPTPLWLVLAIALSCASGCFIVFRLVNGPHQGQQVRKLIKVRTSRPRPLTPDYRPRSEPTTLKSPPVFVPVLPRKPMMPRRGKSQSLVTILPSQHRHPLDKRKETLAEFMDIRKQNSLSTILQKY